MASLSSAVKHFVRYGTPTALLAAVVLSPTPMHAATHQGAAHRENLVCLTPAHGPNTTPAIAFGRTGGNILPMQISIYGDGFITYQGAVPVTTGYAIAPEAVRGLKRLAVAENFWSLPTLIVAPGVLPDIATQYISIQIGCGTGSKTVQVRGSGSTSFTELYATLLAAAGISRIVAPPAAPTATPTLTPPGTPPPTINGNQIVGLSQNNQTLTYHVGQSFLLRLGSFYQWNIQISDTTVLQRQINALLIIGAQGIFVAKAPGQATLTAIGNPLCRASKPACGLPSIVFEIHVTVIPA